MTFVFEVQGLGATHWSRNSALVNASQTSESSASNSRVMTTVFDALSTVKSNSKSLFISYVFSCLTKLCPVDQTGFPRSFSTCLTIYPPLSSFQFQENNKFPFPSAPVSPAHIPPVCAGVWIQIAG